MEVLNCNNQIKPLSVWHTADCEDERICQRGLKVCLIYCWVIVTSVCWQACLDHEWHSSRIAGVLGWVARALAAGWPIKWVSGIDHDPARSTENKSSRPSRWPWPRHWFSRVSWNASCLDVMIFISVSKRWTNYDLFVHNFIGQSTWSSERLRVVALVRILVERVW